MRLPTVCRQHLACFLGGGETARINLVEQTGSVTLSDFKGVTRNASRSEPDKHGRPELKVLR